MRARRLSAESIRRCIVEKCRRPHGSLAASFWRGMKEALPKQCESILEGAIQKDPGSGRSWRLISAALLAMKTRARDCRHLPDTFLEPWLATYGYATGAQMIADLNAACDGVEDAWLDIQSRRYTAITRDCWAPCHYCWRFGRRFRGGIYTCRRHAPASGNTQYKQGRRVRAERMHNGIGWFPSIIAPFPRKMLARVSFRSDDPCWVFLSGLLGKGHADECALVALPRVNLDWTHVLRHLPSVRRLLISAKIIVRHATPVQILETLDPIPDTSCIGGRQLRRLFLHDERLLAGLCAHAEAWLNAAYKRRSRRGKGRRIRRETA